MNYPSLMFYTCGQAETFVEIYVEKGYGDCLGDERLVAFCDCGCYDSMKFCISNILCLSSGFLYPVDGGSMFL
jgi:hypothetical protein